MFLSVLIHKFCCHHCCSRHDVLKRALLGPQSLTFVVWTPFEFFIECRSVCAGYLLFVDPVLHLDATRKLHSCNRVGMV